MQRRPLQQTNTCLMKMKIGSRDLELTTLLDSAALYYSITFYFFFSPLSSSFLLHPKEKLNAHLGHGSLHGCCAPIFFSFFFILLSFLVSSSFFLLPLSFQFPTLSTLPLVGSLEKWVLCSLCGVLSPCGIVVFLCVFLLCKLLLLQIWSR